MKKQLQALKTMRVLKREIEKMEPELQRWCCSTWTLIHYHQIEAELRSIIEQMWADFFNLFGLLSTIATIWWLCNLPMM